MNAINYYGHQQHAIVILCLRKNIPIFDSLVAYNDAMNITHPETKHLVYDVPVWWGHNLLYNIIVRVTSQPKVHDRRVLSSVVRTVFWLVIEKQCSIENYVELTERIQRYTTYLRSQACELDVKLMNTIQFFLRTRHRGLVLMQSFIRKWYATRKKAVKIIESWWFDIVTNPYHHVGQQYIARRAKTLTNNHDTLTL